MADDNDKVAEARRRFLENCGRFAVVTPPTVALMLSAPGSVRAALAASGGTSNGGTTPTTGTTLTTATTPTTVTIPTAVTGSYCYTSTTINYTQTLEETFVVCVPSNS